MATAQKPVGELGLRLRMARDGKSRRRPPWLVIGALVGWALVIVVGAGPSVDDSLLGIEGLDDAFNIALFAAVFVGFMVFVVLAPFSRQFTPPTRKKKKFRGVVALILLFILVWKPELLDSLGDLEFGRFGGESTTAAAEPGLPVEAPEPFVERETVAQATDVLMIIGALVLVGALWWLIQSRLAPDEVTELIDDGVAHRDVAAALSDASLALDAEDDPRLAVLKAYAILEATLATHDAARTRAETPREHLSRSLRRLSVDAAPLLELADLYELARFAERPMTARHRDRAAALLDAAQRQLDRTEAI